MPPGDLVSALEILEKQAAIEIVFQPSQLKTFHSGGVKGSYQPHDAIRVVLKDTPFEPRTDVTGAIVIVPVSGNSTSEASPLLAQAGSEQNQNPSVKRNSATPAAAQLEEVVVTARKHEERLLDVPVPVTVINPGRLLQDNQTSFSDYSNQVPGLSGIANSGSSQIQAVSIRGITTGVNVNPTVGWTLDDVPIGSTTSGGGSFVIPEIYPADLERIEVLRGPQGTLYGASSMGGLIKFVTVSPSTDRVSGTVQAGLSDVHNGAQPGYNVYAAINIPAGSTFAMRASGFSRQDPGYIENVQTGQEGVNESWVQGGRLAALWQISPTVALKLNAILQETKFAAPSEIDVPTVGYPQLDGLAGLQQYRLPGTGETINKNQLYDALLDGAIGSVHFSSITSYSRLASSLYGDATAYFSFFEPLFGGNVAFSDSDEVSNDKFTQELRFSGPLGRSFEWLLGGFYTHEYSKFAAFYNVNDAQTGALVPPLGSIYFGPPASTTTTELAGFTDLTWKITTNLSLQVGGRLSHLVQYTPAGDIACGLLVGGGCTPPSYAAKTTADPFTYMVTPSYRVSSNLMVYARAASGYRAGGGTDSPPPGSTCITYQYPCSFVPDKTHNYELGTKGQFFDQKLTVDTSLYYIDWLGLQLAQHSSIGLTYIGNGNSAKSEGIELTIETRPFATLTISGNVAWDKAVLTKPLANAPNTFYGLPGYRLPYSPQFSGSLSVRQEFPLGKLHGFVEAREIYVGNRIGEFQSSPVRQYYPCYAETGLSIGVHDEAWTANVYANNLTDRQGLLYGGLGYYPGAFGVNRPRTIGLTVTKDF